MKNSSSKDIYSDSIFHSGSLLLRDRAESNSAKRAQDATSAATVLKKAIKLNSLLRNQYEPLLKEAKAISTQS